MGPRGRGTLHNGRSSRTPELERPFERESHPETAGLLGPVSSSETAGVARYTRLDDPGLFLNITYPNQPQYSETERFVDDADWARIQSAQNARLTDMVAEQGILPRTRRNRGFYQSSSEGVTDLTAFAELLPSSESGLEPARGPSRPLS